MYFTAAVHLQYFSVVKERIGPLYQLNTIPQLYNLPYNMQHPGTILTKYWVYKGRKIGRFYIMIDL